MTENEILRIEQSYEVAGISSKASPGTVYFIDKDRLAIVICTNEGRIAIRKKEMLAFSRELAEIYGVFFAGR